MLKPLYNDLKMISNTSITIRYIDINLYNKITP